LFGRPLKIADDDKTHNHGDEIAEIIATGFGQHACEKMPSTEP